MADNPLRALPAVHELLADPRLRAAGKSAAQTTAAVRAALQQARTELRAGTFAAPDLREHLVALTLAALAEAPYFRTVINATGIVLHTNLGRAPLAESAARAAYEAGRGYLNLELDLTTGRRSSRQSPIADCLARLTGAAAATAVNNCAAATVIALRAVAAGRDVIVSRGQLIEIGGGFRIPEIMAVSGARLREVGTTNITRLSDYRTALSDQTAALMRIHTSNYRVRGHVESVGLAELVTLGRERGVPVIDDVGSGLLNPEPWAGDEPAVTASVVAGADLVIFSGDKLLGGPQAGLIVGSAPLIQAIERDPLMRAFRLDKMTLAALEATLRLYLDHRQAELPLVRFARLTTDDLRLRAEQLVRELATCPGLTASIEATASYLGGGTLPDAELPSLAVTLTPPDGDEDALAARLRDGRPAVLARVANGRVWLDLRAVFPEQDAALVVAVRAAVRETSRPALPTEARAEW